MKNRVGGRSLGHVHTYAFSNQHRFQKSLFSLNKRLRVVGRRKRTEKSPFSHENVYACGRGLKVSMKWKMIFEHN